MRALSKLPLRARLMWMASLAVAPALAVIGYTQAGERSYVRERIVDENRRLLAVVANEQAEVFEGVGRLLSTLAEFPGMYADDPKACGDLLPVILRNHSTYANLWVSTTDGTIFCSGVPASPNHGAVSAPSEAPAWIQRAIAARQPVVGDYGMSPLTGKPVVTVAQPLVEGSGRIRRVIAAAVDLDQLNRIAATSNLPVGATVTLFDRHRTIVARYPDGARWLGKPLPASIRVVGLDADATDKPIEAAGVDGIVRLHLTAPAESSLQTGLYASLSLDSNAAFAESNQTFRRELSLLGLVAFATLIIATAGGDAFVLRPVQALVAATNRIASGDLTARAQLTGGVLGLVEIGHAVDQMAAQLEVRERQLVERSRTSALLAGVGVALNEPGPLKRSLQACAEAVVRHGDAGAVRIWTLDGREQRLVPQAAAGECPPHLDWTRPAAMRESAMGRAAADRLPYLVDDMTSFTEVPDREWALSQGLTAFTAHPLVAHRRVVGVIAAYARQRWSQPVKAAFASLADRVALGIERHQVEAARRLLASIVEASGDAVLSGTLDGIILTCNASAARLYGYTEEEIIGRSLRILVPADRIDEPRALFERVSRGEHVKHVETPHYRKDGSLIAVSLTLSPLRNEAGFVTGVSVIARDITERQEAERAVQTAEERVRFALDASRTGIWEADIRTGVHRWSSTLEELHGLVPGTFQGTAAAFLDCVHPDDRTRLREVLALEIRARTKSIVEYRTVWPDGSEHWMNRIGQIAYDETGTPLRAAGVVIDITTRHRLEEQLRQSQKMEAFGQLAGGIAHDFNNLLTVIQGNAQFLLDELEETDPHRQEAGDILRTSHRAAALTHQLLAFSRKQVLTTRVLRLGDIVNGLMPLFRRLIGHNIDLQAVGSEEGMVKADATQMEQVLINLVVNARDAITGVGSLTIETADVLLDSGFASGHPALQPGRHVALRVSDTGCGMDEATRSRVFEPFFTTKPKGQGTGLGLSTVYGIVNQSGGAIVMTTEVNRGSTFTIYMPCTDEPVSAVRPLMPRGIKRGTETILLVEDEEAVRDLVARILRGLGYTVYVAARPSRAIQFSTHFDGTIDLLISDVMLPEMSGVAMSSIILERHPESKLLFISGYTNGMLATRGAIDANVPFLPKPFTAQALADQVRDALDASADSVDMSSLRPDAEQPTH